MANAWYRCLHRLCTAVYFERITLRHAERLPAAGPVLYVGLHRNGAVDGFIYHTVLPRAVFMVSTQLRRNALGRIFFDGIGVVREKDRAVDGGVDTTNAQALQQCLDLLARGGSLFVFPEGTSTLGPRHLPFHSGASRLLQAHLAGGRPITVVPLGIHYECAWAFRSKVEIVAGPPVSTDLTGLDTPRDQQKELRRRIQESLESVGINVRTPEEFATMERIAYVTTLGTDRSYFDSLKALEKSAPASVLGAWQELERGLAARPLLRYQGVPLFPLGPIAVYVIAVAALAPIVAAAIVANLPPFVAAAWAGKKFADDRNVIALWRILVGLPLLLGWVATVSAVSFVLGHGWWLAAYAALTLAGLKLCYRTKKLAVAVHNGLRQPALRARAVAFRALCLKEIFHA